tara:strand:+ start:133 stop:726 length:594 start_codon:yes stop_codon:yes gene_type:complete
MDINMEDYIFIDVETTGANIHDGASYFDSHIPKIDLIEIGMVWREGKVTKELHSKVKPPDSYFDNTDKWWTVDGKPNIHWESLRDAPEWTKLYSWFRGTIGHRKPVAHNADFDAEVLNQTSFHYGLRFIPRSDWLCTKTDAKALMKNETDSFGLKNLAQYLELPTFTHHNALDDAKTCMLLFEAMIPMRQRPDWIFV